MNYDLGFITSLGEDLNNCISLIEDAKNIVSRSNNELLGKWEGLSYSKYLDLTSQLINRYDTKIDDLNEIIGLLNLVKQHNELRILREELKSKITSLKSKLYIEITDDEGNTRTEINQAVADEINRIEREISKINNQMDSIINSIRGITGG